MRFAALDTDVGIFACVSRVMAGSLVELPTSFSALHVQPPILGASSSLRFGRGPSMVLGA